MSYLGINPADSAVINKREYIATAGQTTFPCLYDEYVEVYLNGSRLAADDFTATDGMNVVLTLAAEADDVIVCSGYENARFDNSVSTTGTDTISGVKTFTAQPVGIVKASVGLGNVDDTSDVNKPVSTATQTALNLKANQATTYTKTETDNAIAALVDSAPTALNTLNELAAALGDDVNFSTTVATNIGTVSSNLSSHSSNTSNPHSVTKTQVGLGNVTNDVQVKAVTSTDNAVVRFDGTTGQVQNSGVVIDDSNNISTSGTITQNSTGYLTATGGGVTGFKAISSGSDAIMRLVNTTAITGHDWYFTSSSNGNLQVVDASVGARMLIDSSGNVGIGVTPSGWDGRKVVELGGNVNHFAGMGTYTIISNNNYLDGGYKYKNNGYAHNYNMDAGGAHIWQTAPLGTAGNTITWNTAMTLDASSNLGVGGNITVAHKSTNAGTYKSIIGQYDIGDAGGKSEIRFSGSSGTNSQMSFHTSGTQAMTLANNGNLLVGTTTDNGVDKLQVNGTISSSPKITDSGTITGTFTGGVWYQVPNIDGANCYDPSWAANYIISFYDNSYATGMGNYSNVFTFLTGAINTTSNAGNVINIQLLSRSGHACNGSSMELAWQMTYGNNWPKLMFKLGATSTYTNGTGQYLEFKIRRL